MPSQSKASAPVSLLCLITALTGGGAEMMLYRLMSRLDRTRFRPQVVSMMELGPVGEDSGIGSAGAIARHASGETQPICIGQVGAMAETR